MLPLGIEFTDTINLGGIILGGILAAIALGRALWTVPTKAENDNLRRLLGESREENEDKSRRLNELGAEKDRKSEMLAAADARVLALEEQIEKMPDWSAVIELEHRFAQEARTRQEEFMESVIAALNKHDARVSLLYSGAEDRALDRHRELIEVLRSLRHA